MSIKKVEIYSEDKDKSQSKAKKKKPGKTTYVKTSGMSNPTRIDLEAMLQKSVREGMMKKMDARKKKLKTYKGYKSGE